MEKPSSFKYEQYEIYSAEDVYNYDPVYFKGINLKSFKKTIIEKFNLIENTDYILLCQKKNIWSFAQLKSPKTILCLTKEWVEKKVPKFKDTDEDNNDYEPAPDILELKDEEKFKDNEGNIIEIEVKGTRSYNNCYFKVKDISKGFDAEKLFDTILDKRSLYEKDIDYKHFYISKNPVNNGKNENKERIKRELYLTYSGITQYIIISRNPKTKEFRKWMIQTLFTVQIGTIETKQKLAATILGVDIKTVRKVLSSNAGGNVPCIYLLYIGKANEILKDTEFKYEDDDIICKYGRTTNLDKRIYHHEKKYKKKFNVKIELLTFSIIDPEHLSKVETRMKNYFNDLKMIINLKEENNEEDNKDDNDEKDNEMELIKIKKNNLKGIKEQYEDMQKIYIGHQAGLKDKIAYLNKIIEQKNNELLLKDKDIEITKLDCNTKLEKQILNSKLELKDKDLEIMRLKTILLQNNIKF